MGDVAVIHRNMARALAKTPYADLPQVRQYRQTARRYAGRAELTLHEMQLLRCLAHLAHEAADWQQACDRKQARLKAR